MKRLTWHLMLAFVLFAGFSWLDIQGEDEPITLGEFLTQDASKWVLAALAIAAASYSALGFKESLAERRLLTSALAASQTEGARWRAAARGYSEGLYRAILAQFSAWRLTASESDVALLLLKGLSHKEIAHARKTTPATVRQQAAAIYSKSGLSSRAELAAFFLDDLFPSYPAPEAPASSGFATIDDAPAEPIRHPS
jgi:DNA-binding CsgD family transcriptional regulator